MYGLPDSAIIGTAKHLRGKGHRSSYSVSDGGLLVSFVMFIAFLMSPRKVFAIMQEDVVGSTKKK